MKKTLKALLTLTIAFTILRLPAFAQFAQSKSIYGEDDRLDFYAADADMKTLSDSVVSFWNAASVRLDPASKTYSLQTQNFGDRLDLCPGEKFREQPTGAFCSGSLVGENIVMTAGHCISDEAKCRDARIVFGFALKDADGGAPSAIPESEVYSCKKIIKRFQGAEPSDGSTAGLGADYALIRLDRKVTGHKPLAVNRKQALKNGDKVVVIGHPVGLPLKVAGGASVRDASPDGYFTTDLDTFGGNSGSPVFNASTRLIEGILVRGDEDFKQNQGGSCTTMAVYAQNGGRGEDVTKISELQAFIPKLPSERRVPEPDAYIAAAPPVLPLPAVDLGATQEDLARRFNISF